MKSWLNFCASLINSLLYSMLSLPYEMRMITEPNRLSIDVSEGLPGRGLNWPLQMYILSEVLFVEKQAL
jgi:hypothetical protein